MKKDEFTKISEFSEIIYDFKHEVVEMSVLLHYLRRECEFFRSVAKLYPDEREKAIRACNLISIIEKKFKKLDEFPIKMGSALKSEEDEEE